MVDRPRGPNFSALSRELQAAAVSFAALTTSASAFGATINAFREFERQLVLTNAIAGGTVEQFNRMENAVREFALVTATSATEAASALRFLAQAGFTAEESLSAMTGVLLLSQATLTDISKVSDLVSSNIRAFGLEADQTSRIANVFTASITGSLASIDKLAFALRQVGPVAAVANLSIEETTSFLSQLFNIGLRGEQAGTALRNIIVRLANPVGEARDILREFNIATINADGSMRNLAEILAEVSDANLGEAQLSTIFGLEALAGASALLRSVSGEYQAFTNQITGTNAAFDLFVENLDTTDATLRLAKNALNEFAITIGEQLAPFVRDVAIGLRDLAVAFRDLDPETQQLLVTVGGIAIGLTALVGVVSALIAIFGPFGRLIVGLGAGMITAGRAIANARTGLAGLLAIVTRLLPGVRTIAVATAGLSLAMGEAELAAAALGIALSFMLPGGPLVRGAAALASAVAGGAGLAGAFDDAAEAANRLRRDASRQAALVSAELLVPDAEIEEVEVRLRRLGLAVDTLRSNAFQTGGQSILEAVVGFSSAIENSRAPENRLKEILDRLISDNKENVAALAEFKRLRADLEAQIGGPLEGSVASLGSSELIERIREISGLSPEVLGELEALSQAVSGPNSQFEVLNGIVSSAIEGRQQAVSNLIAQLDDGNSGLFEDQRISDRIAALLDDSTLRDRVREIVLQSAQNGQDASQLRATLLDGFSGIDAGIAQAVADAQEQRVTKLIASLGSGIDRTETAVRQLEVRVKEQEAKVNSNILQAMEAAREGAVLELTADIGEFANDAEKVLTEALGSSTILTGNLGDGSLPLIDLVTLKPVTEQIAELFADGALDAEDRAIIQQAREENTAALQEILNQFILENAIDPRTVAEIAEAYNLFGRQIGALTDNVVLGLQQSEKRITRSFNRRGAGRSVEQLAAQLARLRADSVRTLAEAENAAAQFQQFSFDEELTRGVNVLDAQFENTIAQIDQRIAREAKALGRRLSSDEREAIRNRYIEAAQLTRETGEEVLIQQLRQTALQIQQEIDNTLTDFSLQSIAAQQQIIAASENIDVNTKVALSIDLQSEQALLEFDSQIQALETQFSEIELQFRGEPAQLEAIRERYQALIASVQELRNAEAARNNDASRFNQTRTNVINTEINRLQGLAAQGGDVFDQLQNGFSQFALESTRDIVTVADITRDTLNATAGAFSNLIGDVIFDSENALENFKRTALNISRQVLDKFAEIALQQAIIAAGFGSPSTSGGGVTDPGGQSTLQQVLQIGGQIGSTLFGSFGGSGFSFGSGSTALPSTGSTFSSFGGGSSTAFTSALPVFHGGGGVGSRRKATREVPNSLFDGAPRFHDGTPGDATIGQFLRPSERGIIADVNERVRTPEQFANDTRFQRQGGGDTYQITVQVNGVEDVGGFNRSRSQITKAMGEALQEAKRNT